MAYRDDLEATQARVTALEKELADAHAEIARLEGDESQALVKVGGQALERATPDESRSPGWLGAPIRLELSRVLEGEVPEAAYSELVEAMRQALGSVGTVSVLPGSLAWASNAPANGIGPFVNIYFTMRDGRTTIRVEEKLGSLAGGIFGGVGGGVGGGGLMLPIATLWISPLLVPLAVPLWLGGVYAGCRALYRRSARKRARKLEKLLETLVERSEHHIAAHAALASDGD